MLSLSWFLHMLLLPHRRVNHLAQGLQVIEPKFGLRQSGSQAAFSIHPHRQVEAKDRVGKTPSTGLALDLHAAQYIQSNKEPRESLKSALLKQNLNL